ncbi:MAG: bifunctional serine/threonine protein kinase/MFS transporter [Planctomycetota bacterium]
MQPADPQDGRIDHLWDALVARRGREDLDPESSLTPPACDEDGETLDAAAQADELGPGPLGADGLPPLSIGGADAELSPTRLLGRGGMGEVHAARDHVLRREVALKTLGTDDGHRTRRALIQEALFTGYLDHPNVIPVHRLGVDAMGRPVMVMKRVEGTSWRELARDPEHPTWRSLPSDRLRAHLQILGQVCNAAHYAHSRGVLHRDIKPENVMVGAFGEVYLVDWGAALRLDEREATPSGLVGTPAYMAPEMLEEPRELGAHTDVYLLGATLHRILTDTPRHTGDEPMNVLLAAHRSAPVAYGPEVPPELAALCNAATARDPAQRPASAEAFRRALEEFLERQSSLQLTERARAELEHLRAEAAAPTDPTGRRIASLFAACRFGFEQALAEWPDNPAARDGLQVCLEEAIERELVQRRHTEAVGLLAALPQPRPDLEARARALAEELAAEGDAKQRLEALERDADPRVGARERALHAGFLAAVGYGLVLVLAATLLTGALGMTMQTALGFHLLFGCVVAASAYPGRRWLLSTAVNRRLVQMAVAAWASILLNILAFWAYGIVFGLLILNVGILLTAFAMYVAAAVDARLWVAAGIGSLGVLSGIVLPQVDPLLVHIVCGLTVFAYLALIWSKDPPRDA